MPAIDKLRKGADKANAKLAAQGLGGRLFEVTVETWTAGDPIVGTAGSYGSPLTLSPRPAVDLKAVYRPVEGGLAHVGDAKLSKLSRAYTRAQLEGESGTPARYTIDGKRYALVSLEERPTEWVAVLKGEV